MCQDMLLLDKCLLFATVKYTYPPLLSVFRPTVFSENLVLFHCSKPGYCIEEC